MKNLTCCMLLLLSAFDALCEEDKDFRILVHNSDVYQLSVFDKAEHPVVGVRAYALEITKKILESANQTFSVHNVSLERGLHEIENYRNTIVVPLRISAARLSNPKFLGPIHRERDFLVYKDHGRQKDFVAGSQSHHTACTIRGAAFIDILPSYGIKEVVKTNTYTSCMSMLSANRVDYAAIPESDFLLHYQAHKGIEPFRSLEIGSDYLYIAFSPDIDESKFSAFKATFHAMTLDGRINEMRKTYFQHLSTDGATEKQH